MKVVLALLGAIGISAASLVLSSNSAAAACTMIKADPHCWGDTCRMICAPWGRSLGSAHPESRAARVTLCTPCSRGVKICTYHVGPGVIQRRVHC
jgi:hypothetical protein